MAKPKAPLEAAVRSLAQRTPDCIQAVESWARSTGLFQDDVYTGKAAAGLMDYTRTRRISAGKRTVFIHTGGNLELLA